MSLNAPPPPSTRTVSLTWVIVIVLIAAGAGVAATAAYFALKPADIPGSIGLIDDLGRKVNVPYDPGRIAVLSPSIMDIVYRLGLRSHVVGVDCYASITGSGLAEDYSPDQIALWNLTASMCVEVGPTFAPETLAVLDPQLVFASTIDSVALVEETTNQLHIPVVMLQPPTLSGILVDDDLVGEIFGVSATANSLNAQLNAALYNATNFTSQEYTLPTVLVTYSSDSNGYWTFGPGTFGESLIEISGGASVSANSTTAYPELSPAQILVDEPQFIIYGTGFGLNESSYASGPDWSAFSAVQAGNVSGIDSNWLTEPDPTMILEGIPALETVLYGTT